MTSATWHLVACGVSHKTATLSEREPLQIDTSLVPRANAILAAMPGVHEALVVATCNRVEYYLVMNRGIDPFLLIAALYDELSGIDIAPMRERFFLRKGSHAAAHLFRVAAGMDSMVLGENQILAQIKAAYSSACAVKTAGKLMHRVFHQAFRVGKQVRTDTEMGQGACSVSSAAVDLIKSRVPEDTCPAVLFVGINQMIKLAAASLSLRHHGRFLFANRTPEKAVEFAAQYGGEGYPLTRLPDLLPQADVIISCTGSPDPVIGRHLFDRALAMYPEKTFVVVDMAIPRDVAIDNDYSPRVEVNDLEQIKRFVAEQQKRREEAIPLAEDIVQRRLDEFTYWYQHAQFEPTFLGVSETFERIRREELTPILDSLSFDQREAVENATRRLVDRLLHLKMRDAESL